jgi:hypothetical protein
MHPGDEGHARCPEHPADAALAVCARCGRFLCRRCAHPQPELPPVCAECLRRTLAGRSPRAVLALVLACFTFAGGAPGLVALWLARSERARIRRGEAPLGGGPLLRVASLLAWIELGLLALLALVHAAS